MNKRGLFSTGMAVMLLAVPSVAHGKFSLSGKIQGMPDSIRIVLSDVEDPNGEIRTIAETNPKGGVFELTGEVKSPLMTKLSFQKYIPSQERYVLVNSIPMMIDDVPMSVETSIIFDSLANTWHAEDVFKVKGDKVAQEYAEYQAAVRAAERKADDASYLSARKYFDSNADQDTVRKYNAIKKAAAKEFLDARLAFVKAHPEYNISAYTVQRELENIFAYSAGEIDGLADMVKVCPDTVRTNTVERRRRFAHKYALGMDCPKFDATTPEGEVVNFNSLLTPGKYTFIDFWASWCGPCRQAIPHVKELHKKYAGKLDVYSVSLDENEKAWRKAMEKEQMEWRQFHLKGDDQMGDGAKAFFITTIPRLVILDDKGRVACSTNSSDEVTDFLKLHLGE